MGKYRTIIYKTFAHCQITRGYSHHIAILSPFCHILRSYIMLNPQFCHGKFPWLFPEAGLRHLSTAVTIPGFLMICSNWLFFICLFVASYLQSHDAPALRLPGSITYSKIHCIGKCVFYRGFSNGFGVCEDVISSFVDHGARGHFWKMSVDEKNQFNKMCCFLKMEEANSVEWLSILSSVRTNLLKWGCKIPANAKENGDPLKFIANTNTICVFHSGPKADSHLFFGFPLRSQVPQRFLETLRWTC
jgi:hypothetical protein